MPEKRYHIHLICSPDDQVGMLDGLSIFMEKRAFLTRDLMQGDNESAGYSRRCIDACDYLIMLIGDSYGKLNNTGVSQLHLSYIYAKTKAKPILILLKLHYDNTRLSRQLIDFIRMVEQQNSGSIYYYDEDVCVQEFLDPVYRKFVKKHKSAGWQKVQSRQDKSKSVSTMPAKITADKIQPMDIAQGSASAKLNSVLNSMAVNKEDKKSLTTDTVLVDDSTSLDVEIIVNFTTHAYEDGNLSDINLLASLTWRQILQIIGNKSAPIPFLSFQRMLNELLQGMALQLAQQDFSSKIHAVSRTQVDTQDIQWIVSQMIGFGWISRLGADGDSKGAVSTSSRRTTQDMLQLTELGKQKLAIN